MISSCVVTASKEFNEQLKDIAYATCEQVIDNKFIVLIETVDFDENIATFNKIKALPSVIDINMAFCEAEEYDLATNAQEIADKVNALSNATNIEYYGNIYKKY